MRVGSMDQETSLSSRGSRGWSLHVGLHSNSSRDRDQDHGSRQENDGKVSMELIMKCILTLRVRYHVTLPIPHVPTPTPTQLHDGRGLEEVVVCPLGVELVCTSPNLKMRMM
jgi:hypothetical protein